MISRYDIVLYGASGFTGVYVLKLLIEQQNQENVTFAIAGRNETRLKRLLENLSQEMNKNLQNIPIIIADSYDESTLAAMAKQAKIIINVVGPYRLYGEVVVKAAVENGLYVVSACGWDSIPCDLGVNFLKNKFNGQLNHVETFAQLNLGPAGYSANVGTYRTFTLRMINILTDDLDKIRRSIMPEKLPISSFPAPKRSSFWFNEKIDGWCLPFKGADKSVITRSQYFEYKLHNVLPKSLYMYSYIYAIRQLQLIKRYSDAIKENSVGNCYLVVNLLYVILITTLELPLQHERASLRSKASVIYLLVFGTGWTEKHSSFDDYSVKPVKEIVARCVGPDAGYVTTSACVLASALSLLKDADKLPQGGVHTPTSAFKETGIYDRLEKYGVRFEIVDKFY
ncbi:Saccharopine dehydrogenase [Dirofilaria immitis]|nr:Saccharopine dehydrogenase [Dirofilaria immitis]